MNILRTLCVVLGDSDPGANSDGPFVAEVWLEWPICRGSTLYRDRFESQEAAAVAAKRYAAKLDGLLPTHYRTDDYFGRPVLERYEYGILFGVRRANEHDSHQRVWSPVLPGHKDYAGEHASAHPAYGDAERLSADGAALAGFKL